LSCALADDVKPITCILLAHSAAPHTLNDLWQGMRNNDDSFPKQGRYWKFDDGAQEILELKLFVRCKTHSNFNQDCRCQQLITISFRLSDLSIHLLHHIEKVKLTSPLILSLFQ
jgi:hypothetical protein